MKDGRIVSDERSREPENLIYKEQTSVNLNQESSNHFKRAFKNLLKSALQSIVTHPLRSLLTGLGVFIGVVSVVWLLAIGEGIADQAEGEIMELGASNLIISSKRPPEEERSSKGAYFYSYGLTENDYQKISKTVPHIQHPTRRVN